MIDEKKATRWMLFSREERALVKEGIEQHMTLIKENVDESREMIEEIEFIDKEERS